MRILALETSCDETSASVVENGTTVLSLTIASQIDLHNLTGGVVPEVAAREHPLKIWPVIHKTLQEASLTLNQIDAFAATAGPGLLPALLTGYLTARTLAHTTSTPFIPVHHTLGHIYSNFLERPNQINFPFLTLTVSGGHNQIFLFQDHFHFTLLGTTRDDAAGEAFDKVARLLSLPYPGGPSISRAAESSKSNTISLPLIWLNETPQREKWDEKNYDFSFSGLKTAVRSLVLKQKTLTPEFIADTAHSFQESVTEVLATKLVHAASHHKVKEVHLAGGVSANLRLRELITQKLSTLPSPPLFRYPEKFPYCTDNAAMIASAAYFQTLSNLKPNLKDVSPSLPLSLFQK